MKSLEQIKNKIEDLEKKVSVLENQKQNFLEVIEQEDLEQITYMDFKIEILEREIEILKWVLI